jgi:hypothetical protein
MNFEGLMKVVGINRQPSDVADEGENTGSASSTWQRRIARGTLTLVLLALVMVVHGLVPGLFFPCLGASQTIMAQGQSLALGSFWSYPSHFGYPLGAPILLNFPFAYTEAILLRLTPLNVLQVFIISNWLFLGIAFFGCREFFKRFNIDFVLASIGAALYLVSIFVLGHQGILPLMLAFALLPTTVWLDMILRDAVVAPLISKRRIVVLAICCLVWRTMLLFLDGYTFVICSIFSLSLWGFAWLRFSRADGWKRQLVYGALLAMSFAVPYLLYNLYVPGSGVYTVMSANFFRAQGVDLATLVLPMNDVTQLAKLLGLHLHYNGFQFFGDGSNAFYNYLGVALPLAVAGVICTWRNTLLLPLVIAGVFCLVLSIGPSLKIYTLRKNTTSRDYIVYSDYLMSPDKAVANFHTDKFYTRTPAVKVMRAVYRWLIGFKFVVLSLALIAVSTLYRRRYVVLASCLLLLLILDTLPPVQQRLRQYRGAEIAVRRFYADVIPELRKLIPKGSLIIFDSTENDYLADPIAVALEARSYNVAGDKNAELASSHWPSEVKAIRKNKSVIANAKHLHMRGQLDYLILPHFNMRWNSYWWPPDSKQVAALKMAAQQILASSGVSGLRIAEGKYATVVGFDGAQLGSDAPY